VPSATVEEYYRSTVQTLWHELHGLRGLHASAVVIAGRAVGFLANSGHGKSTTASAFLRSGYPLLTDDIVAVEEVNGEFLAHPGYPRLRLWSDNAQNLGIAPPTTGDKTEPAQEESVGRRNKWAVPVGQGGVGRFADESVPLGRMYVLDRSEEAVQVEIQPLSPRDAVIEMVRFTFLIRLTTALGMQPERLAFFSRLAQQVPISRLRFPSGLEHLPALVQAVLVDTGP
jgi:hypothetical protein